MAAPREKLAASLEVLRAFQTDGRRIFKSQELTRTHRERLVRNGFLRQVIKGWLMSSRPDTSPGDTASWYASFWEFCARYSSDRFGDEWHLSPELSLLIHAEATAVPRQVVIYTPHGSNNSIELPFDTSLYDLASESTLRVDGLVIRGGLRIFALPAALVRVPESFFVRHPIEAEVVLGSVSDASDVLHHLLEGGHSAVAGRLAGAFRRTGREEIAEEILHAMRAAGYDPRESDPFTTDQRVGSSGHQAAPMVRRIESLWNAARESVLDVFPDPPSEPREKADYLKFIDDIYESDAYHSLSIEGYSVTPELIARVRAGDRDPERRAGDREQRDALAARGYWQAFQGVKRAVAQALEGSNAGSLARDAHREWYRELFQPFVAAGVLPASTLAGYRSEPVYLKGSRHVPPRAAAVRDAMPALFELLSAERESSVRAVLGHWLVGYVHPYPDGNGRIARFLMNVMLAAGGHPWTVIRVEDRGEYLSSLEAASVENDIEPFARFVARRVRWSDERGAHVVDMRG